MDLPPRLLDPDARPTKPIIIPNGTLKKHTHTHTLPRRPPPPPDLLYRECLKNHAASLGGHALDGCGEFMPSPTATPTDPTSLKCAACGCHRNFHRRLPDPGDHGESEDEMDGDDEEDDKIEDEEDDKMEDPPAAPPQQRRSGSPPAYFSSAPHMLLALRGGPVVNPVGLNPVGGVQKKRFRSKFSPEQKERMQQLSERLGWRMQKRDEGVVEEWCKGIGVGKGVFKVWMHNNKHNFVVRRGEVMGSSSSSGGVGVNGGGGGTVVVGNGGVGIHGVVNGSSSST